jgi:hypothetical protein
MKKELTILMVISIVMCSMIGYGTAECESNMEVGSTLEINGRGTIDRDLLAQSEWGYNGQRLTETMYSRWMTTDGISNISYSSDLNVYLGASETQEDVNTTEITYAQTTFTTNMNQRVCSQNYNAGVMSSFKTLGMSAKAFEIEMLPDSNYIELEGAIDGKATLKHMVVDPDSRLKIVKEVTRLKGQYDIDWNAYAENLIYPGDEGDFLGCP